MTIPELDPNAPAVEHLNHAIRLIREGAKARPHTEPITDCKACALLREAQRRICTASEAIDRGFLVP